MFGILDATLNVGRRGGTLLFTAVVIVSVSFVSIYYVTGWWMIEIILGGVPTVVQPEVALVVAVSLAGVLFNKLG